jgi:hypothetical protein
MRLIFCLLTVGLVAAAPYSSDTIAVRAGEDLQAALDRARPGDTITLEPGATFTGNFLLTNKGPAPASSNRRSSQYITVRTAISDSGSVLPGWRMTPERASGLAKIRSNNSSPAMRTAPGAHHWRLELLEFPATASGSGTIIDLGDGSETQNTLASVPHDLVIDRCYIHGDPGRGQKRGIGLNSASTTITGSYISEIKVVGQDTQAIGGWNGPGPFKIENNYLEAAGENFMLGGAIPGIRDLVPSDVVFRRNHVTRPVDWREERWTVKNLFELKNGRRVLVEANIFEQNWRGAQAGYAIVLTPSGQNGKAPWAVVEDVTFRHNIVRHTAAGVNIRGRDDGGASGLAQRIEIVDNLFYGLDRNAWGGNGFFLLIGDGPGRVTVNHNTIIQTGNVISAYGGSSKDPMPVRDFTFTNNLALHNANGVHGDGQSVGLGAINAYFPDAVFSGNVLAGGRASRYPAGNEFPDEETFARQFVNFGQGDFRLAGNSSFQRAATDRRDIGADIPTILAKTNGVIEGRPDEDSDRAIRRSRDR